MGIYRIEKLLLFLSIKSSVSPWAWGRAADALHEVVGQANTPFFDGDVEEVPQQGKVKTNCVGRAWPGIGPTFGVLAIQSGQAIIPIFRDDLGTECSEGVLAEVLKEWLGVAGFTGGGCGALCR